MPEPHDLAEHPAGEAPSADLPVSFPVGPPEAVAPAERAYRSLSLLALIGFSAAAVYVTSVVLLGLVAFGSGKPLQLGVFWGWFALLPVAVCAVAWLRIYRSEETLAGGPLARWGLLLAGFAGLGYGAYYSAVSLALRQQADQFAREWLDLLRQGRLDQAMFRTLSPVQRAGISEDSKDLLEKFALANESAGETPPAAMLQHFAQIDLVHLLAQGGSGTTIVSRGFEWDFKQGGYEVKLSFHIETPECSAEIMVTVHGTEAPHGEFAGRQWRVLRNGTRVDEEAGGIRKKPLGDKVERLAQTAGRFLGEWQQQLNTATKEEAFLLTLPEDERPRSRRALHRALASAALAGGGTAPDGAILAAYHRFLAGGLVEEAPAGFATEEDFRKKVVGGVRNMFAEGTDRATLVPDRQQKQIRPSWTRKENKIQFAFAIGLRDRQSDRVDVAFLVEGDARALEGDAPPRWRIAGVKPLSAMKPPAQGRRPGPGG